MIYRDRPRGSSLGKDPNPKSPTPLDYQWVLQHGTRAQRRAIIKQAKSAARKNIAGAAQLVDEISSFLSQRTSRVWLVDDGQSAPFAVDFLKPVTGNHVAKEFPGSIMVALDD